MEIEADQMAEKIGRMPERSFTGGGGIRPEENSGSIHRINDEDAADLQPKSSSSALHKTSGGNLQTTPAFASDLKSGLHSGESLPEPVRIGMEGAFNADFTGVRIHADSKASTLSSQIGAHAFYLLSIRQSPFNEQMFFHP